jgi:hypothetical protein
LLAALLLLAACSPSKKADEEQNREIHGLKAEIAQLKEKLAKLETEQQAIWDLVKKPGVWPEAATQMETAPGQPLTVSQLIAGKDRLIGTRVRVKGLVGPVLVHHKSLLLKSPEGMVEVFFGNLEEKLVQRLTSTLLDQPVTVTGMVNPAPKGGAKLMITAEGVEF